MGESDQGREYQAAVIPLRDFGEANVRYGLMMLIKSTISRAVLKCGFLWSFAYRSHWGATYLQLTLNATNSHAE